MRACVTTGEGSYITNSFGRAAQEPNAHRLLAARSDRRLKGMSAATARCGIGLPKAPLGAIAVHCLLNSTEQSMSAAYVARFPPPLT